MTRAVRVDMSVTKHIEAYFASDASTGPRMVLEGCDVFLGQSLDTDEILRGHVCDFRLWSRALTVSEVAAGRKVCHVPLGPARGENIETKWRSTVTITESATRSGSGCWVAGDRYIRTVTLQVCTTRAQHADAVLRRALPRRLMESHVSCYWSIQWAQKGL